MTQMTLLLVVLAAAALQGSSGAEAHGKAPKLGQMIAVETYGARGDGKTDDTAAFQRALDAARGAGVPVYARKASYRFAGQLNVPDGVTLKGSFDSVPSHNGVRDKGMPMPGDVGTTLLVTGGAGSETGTPFITLHNNSTVRGLLIYYPDQDPASGSPKPYPWTIAMRGKNPAVLDVELLNPYQGIDASDNERHLIRNVSGQPLRRGIYIDSIYDIGRLENVHFNPWWSMSPALVAWQHSNGEAFIFGRTDWQYVLNTFCFGYKVGYHFIQTSTGVTNGNFLGIGADDCIRAVTVDGSAPFGILITNGEFVSFHGTDPTMVEVTQGNSGSVRFVNCAFWGPCEQIAKVGGKGTVGFSDCTFVEWDRSRQGRAAIQASGGTVLIRGCEFRADRPQVLLGPDVRRAVVAENVFTGAERITNASRGNVQTGLNTSGH